MAVKCILTGQTPSVLDGVTENVQTQIDAKQDKISLTANRAVVVGTDGKLAVSDVTSTELGYLDGVTSNIQTQLNSKLSSAPVTSVAGKTGAVTLAKSDVGLGNVDNTSDLNKPISTAMQTALDNKQDKITASGLLAGDGEGNITAAEETEVELVEITPDTIGAQSKITASGLLKGDGSGGITAAVKETDYAGADRFGFVPHEKYADENVYTAKYPYGQGPLKLSFEQGAADAYEDDLDWRLQISSPTSEGYSKDISYSWNLISPKNSCTFAMDHTPLSSDDGKDYVGEGIFLLTGCSAGIQITSKAESASLVSSDIMITPSSSGAGIEIIEEGASGNSIIYLRAELVEVPTPTTDDGAANKAYVDTAVKGTTASVILASASWGGTAAPYTYTISNSAITTASTQEVLPSTDITADQLTALQEANIIDGGQAAGSMTLKAFGEKPSIDIPIRVVIKG